MKDYEQLYYDLLYENRLLKSKVKVLEETLENSNKGNIKKYLVNQIIKYKEKTNI